MNGGTISCGFGCNIFFLCTPPTPYTPKTLLEDVLECTPNRPSQCFHVAPSAVAIHTGPAAAHWVEVSLQPTWEQLLPYVFLSLFSNLSQMTSHRLCTKLQNHFAHHLIESTAKRSAMMLFLVCVWWWWWVGGYFSVLAKYLMNHQTGFNDTLRD